MVDTKEDLTELGPWDGADFQETTRTTGDFGVDSGLPDDARFISSVAKLIRRRNAQEGADSDPKRLAVFLLAKITQAKNLDVIPQREPMLYSGLTPLTGRLWFVPAVVKSGKYIELRDLSNDELFCFVTDELHLGNVPAIILDPRPKVSLFIFYPKGLNNPNI